MAHTVAGLYTLATGDIFTYDKERLEKAMNAQLGWHDNGVLDASEEQRSVRKMKFEMTFLMGQILSQIQITKAAIYGEEDAIFKVDGQIHKYADLSDISVDIQDENFDPMVVTNGPLRLLFHAMTNLNHQMLEGISYIPAGYIEMDKEASCETELQMVHIDVHGLLSRFHLFFSSRSGMIEKIATNDVFTNNDRKILNYLLHANLADEIPKSSNMHLYKYKFVDVCKTIGKTLATAKKMGLNVPGFLDLTEFELRVLKELEGREFNPADLHKALKQHRHNQEQAK